MLLAVATLAVGQALSLIATRIDYIGGSLGFQVSNIRTEFWPTMLILVGALVVVGVVRRKTLGMALYAAGREETVTESLGVSITVMRMWGFGLGAVLAGIGGGLLVQFTGVIYPSDLGFQNNALLFTYVIMGGVSTQWGAVLGAIGVTWGLEGLRKFDGLGFKYDDRFWILGALLTAVVLFRPQGVVVRRSERLRGPDEPWWNPRALLPERFRRDASATAESIPPDTVSPSMGDAS
jgi:branched-chain amino acid transport system permease protein